MGQELLYFSVAILIRAGLLIAGLFIIIKIMKLDWNVIGLVGSALLAGGIDVIPLVGHFIAPPVLFVCVAAMTHFSLFPSVIASAVAAGVMLGAAHFIDPRVLPGHSRARVTHTETMVAATNAPEADEMISITNPPSAIVTNAGVAGATNRPATPYEIARTFTLKSVINNSSNSLATIHTGTRTYTIGLGESLAMDTPNGKTTVHCDKINVNSVVLTIAGRHVSLYLR